MTQPSLPKKPTSYPSALGSIDDEYWGLRTLSEEELKRVLDAEDSYWKAQRAGWAARAEQVAQRAKDLVGSKDHTSYPVRYQNWLVFTHTPRQAQRSLKYVTDLDADRAEVAGGNFGTARCVLDENALAAKRGEDGYELGSWELTKDGKIIVYTDCADGSEKYTVRVRDVETGKELEGPSCIGAGVELWTNTLVLYTELDEQNRPWQVRAWDCLSGQSQVVYTEDDPSMFVHFESSEDRQHLMVTSGSHTQSQGRIYQRTEDNGFSLVATSPKAKGTFYYPAAEKSLAVWAVEYPDYTTEVLDVHTFERIVPVREGKHLLASTVATDGVNVYVQVREGAGVSLEIWDNGDMVRADVPGDAYLYSASIFENDILVGSTTWTAPGSIWKVDPVSGKGVMVHQRDLPDFNPDDYREEHRTIRARDGEDIPVSVVYHKDAGKTALVNAYGAYGISMDPYFSASRVAFLDSGAKFVVVHARGGGEKGRAWHEAGRGANKMNTFTDVIDAVRALKSEGVVDKVVLDGGSAGGATVTMATILAPDEFAAVVADVPFVDALATMSDPSLPLTVAEYGEWGDASTPEGAAQIAEWSPVDNIEPGRKYPDFFITVGVNDPRVGYWEGLKLAARLRDANSANKAIVRAQRGAGHAGGTGRWDAIEQAAESWAFVEAHLNAPAHAIHRGVLGKRHGKGRHR